jgi:predicted DNA-binding protein YlxM (UPF0122 family)/5-methylcytosine-specific restriction endonuclease McrA
MQKSAQEGIINAYIKLSDELGEDEPTLTEFQKHSQYGRGQIYNAFESFNTLKHKALFRQGKKLYKSEDYLRREYVEKERSTKQIAEDWDIDGAGVHHWIEKHGIETRDRSESQTDGDIDKLRNGEWLEREYVDKERHATDLADEVGVSAETIYRWLREHGIPVRDEGLAKTDGDLELVRDEQWLREQYLADEKSMHQIGSECNVQHSTVKRYIHQFGIETRAGGTDMSDGDLERLNDATELTRLYWDERMSMSEIADELDVRMKTVHRKMQEFGIDRRGYDERRSGKEHPLFKEDSISYYGMYWEEQKLKARKRDQCRCQWCGKTDAEHRREHGRVNHVHHIEKVSSFVEDGELNEEKAHRLENLLTLCLKHHKKLEGLPIDNRFNRG